ERSPTQTAIFALHDALPIYTATDADLPANALTYQLVSSPAGASISASGVISWTPNEGQGPSTNTFTTVVTDKGTAALSATNSFPVRENEGNNSTALPAPAAL